MLQDHEPLTAAQFGAHAQAYVASVVHFGGAGPRSVVRALDTHLQAVELLRDVSHARDHKVGQWREKLGQAGFAVEQETFWRLRMYFAAWTQRIGTPAPLAEAIRPLQEKADDETRAFFAIESDGSFQLDAAMFLVAAV
ncbi:hypothetical protein K9U39_04145 [Rhodoblastus acidophilus]|uniref:SAM-dependent methyltransferase n=1 Tax=Candidatus Rhodoblastus alkanivorans TaxID=2954117 RepID=A0ABS9Z5U2_9HYPH|nr:hypothetical protein [Candidatus Rhodoblastus alkanivorans]MCI4678490.1 hypothetical protein [Candidatus Rhodoblastus alkanivorans]MCI4682836.1 hypothetical protein [Candidatus Rhodoblastus alkanivorans]MDI4640146.1 hypothetical protein [Rhodoblastus acidophilus]